MKKQILTIAALFALTSPAFAQTQEPAKRDTPAPSPNQIVDEAAPKDWVRIVAEDLLVMTLAPDADGNARKVIIQLMPAPFSQGWVSNIRTLARAKWYDGITVNRVQDNYVAQWGDANGEAPEKAKPLPEGLKVMAEGDYVADNLILIPDPRGRPRINYTLGMIMMRTAMIAAQGHVKISKKFAGAIKEEGEEIPDVKIGTNEIGDSYSSLATLALGWPIAADMQSDGKGSNKFWPVHCYGMVGVGRNYSPDTGSGAELYTVIGHAPRHLDRNIALVGRIISGMEHLSSLPRGSGALGFYTAEEAHKRTPIQSIRIVSDMPAAEQPSYEYLSTESEAFAKYAEARANRRDPFFIVPAGGADICNIPVPVRAAEHED